MSKYCSKNEEMAFTPSDIKNNVALRVFKTVNVNKIKKQELELEP